MNHAKILSFQIQHSTGSKYNIINFTLFIQHVLSFSSATRLHAIKCYLVRRGEQQYEVAEENAGCG